MTFTLKRTGRFSVRTSGANHCGTNQSLDINYRLEVRCTADSLDERGFLFDQTHIDRWFQSQRTCSISSEQYALQCSRELYKLILRENGGCKVGMFSLTLSPAPYAAELTFAYGA